MAVKQGRHVKRNVWQTLVTQRALIGLDSAVNGPVLLMERERQQVIVRVKPIRARLINKNAEPTTLSNNTQNAGDTPPRRLEDPEGPDAFIPQGVMAYTVLAC